MNGKKKRESIFLSERFMKAACIFAIATGLASMILRLREGDAFAVFESLTKLLAAGAMYLAFSFFKWDVAKGLMGGFLFSLMYQEAHLVLAQLWAAQDFDVYLVAGVQGSLYIAAAGMSFLMTVIITVNHFFINYATSGNTKDVIFNRMAILFKLFVYILLVAANSGLGFASVILWRNALGYLSDIALLLLLVSVEAQMYTFSVLRHELLKQKRERGKKA